MRVIFPFLILWLTFLPVYSEEVYHYVVKWMGIVAGRAQVTFKEEGKIKATLRTVGIFDLLYYVRDSLSSWVDEEGNLVRLVTQLQEGKYRYQEEVVFSEKKGEKNGKEFSVPSGVKDPLSLLLYLKGENLPPGEITVPVYIHGKVDKLRLKIEKEEEIKIYGHSYKVIPIIPDMSTIERKGLAKKIKEATLYLTSKEKIPLLIEVFSSFGRITALLENRDGLSRD